MIKQIKQDEIDQLQRLLQDKGLRATSQRKVVLEVIANHDGPLAAEDIHLEARRLNPRISLATVYRTLTALKDAGVIDQYYLTREHDRSHFEMAVSPKHGSFHFHCLRCGTIIEFDSPQLLQALQSELNTRYGVDVMQACICSDGYCAQCRSAAPNTDETLELKAR